LSLRSRPTSSVDLGSSRFATASIPEMLDFLFNSERRKFRKRFLRAVDGAGHHEEEAQAVIGAGVNFASTLFVSKHQSAEAFSLLPIAIASSVKPGYF
jgi:hypothetical protein